MKQEMINYLTCRYDYVSKLDAIQELKTIYGYIDGWLSMGVSAYNSISL